jgi:hypothetical protein
LAKVCSAPGNGIDKVHLWGGWGESPIAPLFDHCEIPLNRVRVVLRHAGIGIYYAGRKHWLGKADSALDLGTIERATELSRDESFEEMQILVTCGDPARELVLPIVRQQTATDEPLHVAA